jgi:hypothetical protein
MAENVVINFEANTDPLKKAERDLKDFGKTGTSSVDALSSSLKNLAAGIVGALSVNAIINFSKECVSKFAQAELQTNQLKFAIEKVGKMGEKVFQDLVKQSKDLAKVSFYDDEDIQQAQKVFVQLGLNANEIKKLTPLVLDLASAQGTDLATATEKTVGAINGMTRGLRDVGADFKDTGSKVGNLNEVFKQFGKLQGASADALNTTAGAMRKAEVDAENLQEQIGERLAPALMKLKSNALGVAATLVNVFFPDDAKKQLEAVVNQIKGSLEQKYNGSPLSALKDDLATIPGQLKDAQSKIDAIKADPSHHTHDEIEAAKEYYNFIKHSEYALRILILERENETRGDIKNVNSLKKKDQEEANAKAKEESAKKHKQYLDDLKKDLDAWDSHGDDEIASMADRLGKEDDLKKKQNEKEIDDLEKQWERETNVDIENEDKKKKRKEELAKQIRDIEFQIASESINGILDIYSSGLENQISLIQKLSEEKQSALDKDMEANQHARDTEMITEREFQAQNKKLLDQKTKNEIDARKKINEIKHKEDIANKIQKIFQIAIATAKNIVEEPALTPYWIALGGIQAAFVAAQPLPKYHKGRLASFSSEEEHAIVRKDETILNPKTSKEYHPVLSAIHKGSVPAFALNDFVKNFRLYDFAGGRSLNMLDPDKFGSAIEWHTRGQNNAVTKRLEKIEKAIIDGRLTPSDIRRIN